MWPVGFSRIPQGEPWVQSPIEELARKYDTVENHGWYHNLDPVLEELQTLVKPGDIIIDYSAGTGILVEHFLTRAPSIQAGFVLVDASPKFLRLALEKLGTDERTAFRLIQRLKSEKRLQLLDEVLPESICTRGIDVLCSTNAIHLYYDLPATLASWVRLLKSGAHALIQSGNINNPDAPADSWIIDDTVERLQPVARALVRDDDAFEEFRPDLADDKRLAQFDDLRKKYFLPVRPLDYYVDALRAAGFEIVEVYDRVVDALVSDWTEFLATYHEGVLGWAGGSKRIDGRTPSENTITLRRDLLRQALSGLFDEQPSFEACWTYIRCRKP